MQTQRNDKANIPGSSDLGSVRGEGGVAGSASALEGSPSQVEWAERIKCAVQGEFDRVAASFEAVAIKQEPAKRVDTEAVIAILEDKRTEVMSVRRAGYFIKFWQEITDQVRQLIFHDPRYQEMKARRDARPR